MRVQAIEELVGKRCRPCEGGVEPYTLEDSRRQLVDLNGWRIRKEWKVKHFMSAMEFFNRVAEVAEDDGHHPDLHVSGYRHVAIELWTHAIGGLSENDFILAAKIDQLPIELAS